MDLKFRSLSIGTNEYEVETKEFGTLTIRSKEVKPMTRSTSLPPNVIHSVDGYIMSETSVITPIHDSFGSHPNDCDLIRGEYKSAMIKLNQSNLLSEILSEIEEQDVQIQKHNTLTTRDIRWATHSLS